MTEEPRKKLTLVVEVHPHYANRAKAVAHAEARVSLSFGGPEYTPIGTVLEVTEG